MSDIGGDDGGTGCESGMDNLAFAIEDECVNVRENVDNNVHEQQTVNKQQLVSGMEQQKDYRSSTDPIGSPKENGGNRRSFVSQHYVEPVRNSPEPRYKSETKIEVPPSAGGQTPDKNSTGSEPKLNGVHGNGNNNDASFLNSSATSVQVNGKLGS